MAYDAVIVGGGPAGGMAARELARNGFKVVILDHRREIGVPVQCGEAMGQVGLDLNDIEPQKEWIKHRVKGIKVFTPNGSSFTVSLPGYSIDRAKFDKWIVKAAVRSGADLILNTKAWGLAKREDVWRVATDRQVTFEGKVVIGADGPASNIARWAGLLISRTYWKAMEYKFDASHVSYPIHDWLVFYLGERFSGGYGWVFPRGDEFNVGAGGFGQIKGMTERMCDELGFDFSRAMKRTGGNIPYRHILRSLATEGLMIAGDAAGATNPIFGGGIHPALSTGHLAGEIASKALEAGDMSIARQYDIVAKASPYFDPVLWKAADFFGHWDDEHYDFFSWIVGEGGEWRDLTLVKGAWKVLTRRPRLLLEAGRLLKLWKALKITQQYGW